jgi:hypothetical protein
VRLGKRGKVNGKKRLDAGLGIGVNEKDWNMMSRLNLIRVCLLSALVLFAPPLPLLHAQFAFITNNGSITITGYTGNPTTLSARPWVPLQSASLTNGSFYFSDPQWANYPGRYYRIGSP